MKEKKTPIRVVVSMNTMRGAGEHGKPFMFLKEQAEKGGKKTAGNALIFLILKR